MCAALKFFYKLFSAKATQIGWLFGRECRNSHCWCCCSCSLAEELWHTRHHQRAIHSPPTATTGNLLDDCVPEVEEGAWEYDLSAVVSPPRRAGLLLLLVIHKPIGTCCTAALRPASPDSLSDDIRNTVLQGSWGVHRAAHGPPQPSVDRRRKTTRLVHAGAHAHQSRIKIKFYHSKLL